MNKINPDQLCRDGFTLIEVAISMAILTIGITAAVAMIMTGIKWSTDIKINETALHTCNAVLQDVTAFELDERNAASTYSSNTTSAEGWLNGYYVVRTINSVQTISDSNGGSTGGNEIDVTISLYHGGDKDSGEIELEVSHRYISK